MPRRCRVLQGVPLPCGEYTSLRTYDSRGGSWGRNFVRFFIIGGSELGTHSKTGWGPPCWLVFRGAGRGSGTLAGIPPFVVARNAFFSFIYGGRCPKPSPPYNFATQPSPINIRPWLPTMFLNLAAVCTKIPCTSPPPPSLVRPRACLELFTEGRLAPQAPP